MPVIFTTADFWIESFYIGNTVNTGVVTTTTFTLSRAGRIVGFSVSKLTGSGLIAFQTLTSVALSNVGGGDLTYGTSITAVELRRSNDSGTNGFMGGTVLLFMRK